MITSRSGDVLRIGELFMLHQLHEEGLSISEIARRSGLDRKTVRKYLQQGVQAPRCAQTTLTTSSSLLFRVQAQCSPLDCWRPLETTGRAISTPVKCKLTRVSRQPFSGRPLWNGPASQCVTHSGPMPATSNKNKEGNLIRPLSVRWPSSGSASCSVVGNNDAVMTKPNTSMH